MKTSKEKRIPGVSEQMMTLLNTLSGISRKYRKDDPTALNGVIAERVNADLVYIETQAKVKALKKKEAYDNAVAWEKRVNAMSPEEKAEHAEFTGCDIDEI